MLQLNLLLKYLPFSIRLRLEQQLNSTLTKPKLSTSAPLPTTSTTTTTKQRNYTNLLLPFSSTFATPITYVIAALQEIRITLLNT